MQKYNKRFNAQRAAKSSLGADAIEGQDFTTSQTNGEWEWTPIVAPVTAAPTTALPTPPDFTANTHKAWRKLHARLVAMADARDVDALRAAAIPTYSSSPRALGRYRDAVLSAIGGN